MFNIVAIIMFRMLERLAGIISRPLTMQQLSVVYAVLDHVVTAAHNNLSRLLEFTIYRR